MEYKPLIGILIFLAICIFTILILQLPSGRLSPFKLLNNCAKSLIESDNFICESDKLWNERKALYQIQDKANMQKLKNKIFFLTNWEPNFHCSHARRIGKMGDGGKWVCDLFRLKTRPDCLIYSAGSNGDFSFEIDMKKSLPHCEVHTFDMNRYKCPENVCIFHQVIFGDGTHPAGSKNWQTIIKELNHTDRLIDVFKIDIEGGEYDFFPVLFQSLRTSFPRQILVELHQKDAETIHRFFELLRANNYVIFNKEPNLIAGPHFFEYTFLKLNDQFFT
jgi:hypothetical protein